MLEKISSGMLALGSLLIQCHMFVSYRVPGGGGLWGALK